MCPKLSQSGVTPPGAGEESQGHEAHSGAVRKRQKKTVRAPGVLSQSLGFLGV